MDRLEKIKKLAPTQESGLRNAIFLIIKELRQETDISLSDTVIFELSNDTKLTPATQRKVIKFLINVKVIEILSSKLSPNPIFETLFRSQKALGMITNEPIEYTLKVNREELLELYKLYLSLYEKDRGTETLSFDDARGALSFRNKTVSFKPNSQSFAILSALINNNDIDYSFGDTFSFQEINTLVTMDGSTNEISEKAFRNSVTHINEQMKNNIGIEEFLIIKNGGININLRALEK